MKRNNRYVELANDYIEEVYNIIEEQLALTGQPYIPMKLRCEQLYRVISLIAYGNTYKKNGQLIGLATWKDIEGFTIFAPDEKMDKLTIELPAVGSTTEELEGTNLVIPSAMRESYPNIVAHTRAFSDYQTFTLFHYKSDGSLGERVMASLLGQLVVNKFAVGTFRGWFDGKPQMESNDEIEEAWITLASLPSRQAPALCQCCGKVLDRRVGAKGGRPALTCGKSNPRCSQTFNNEQRRLIGENDPAAGLIDTLEQKAREVRWRNDNDGRPLQYPSIHLPC